MTRVKSRTFAGLTALALASGILAAVQLPGNAATTGCGASCSALASQKWGTGFVTAVSGGISQAGQPIVLSTAGQFSAEDFKAVFQGTVADFYQAGLVVAAVGKTWPSLNVYEYEYAPGGTATTLCLGTAATAANGTAVSLQPCQVTSRSVWILLDTDNLGGAEPLINASDTVINTPYVLTAGGTAGGQLTTHALNLVAGTFNPAQMWTTLSGVLLHVTVTLRRGLSSRSRPLGTCQRADGAIERARACRWRHRPGWPETRQLASGLGRGAPGTCDGV